MPITVVGIDPGIAYFGIARIVCDRVGIRADIAKTIRTEIDDNIQAAQDNTRRMGEIWEGCMDAIIRVDIDGFYGPGMQRPNVVAYEAYTPYQDKGRRTAHGTKTAYTCGLAASLGFSVGATVMTLLPQQIKRAVADTRSCSKSDMAAILCGRIDGLEDILLEIPESYRDHASDAAAVAYAALMRLAAQKVKS